MESALKDVTRHWWLFLLRGLLALIVGIVALAIPFKTIYVFTLLVGLLLIIDSIIVGITSLVTIKKNDRWWVLLLQSLLTLVLGLFVFNYPELSIKILFLVMVCWLFVVGILTVFLGISLRKDMYGGWLISGLGMVLVIFSIIMLAVPVATVTVFTILFALSAIVSGVMWIASSFEIKNLNLEKLETI